MKLKALRVHGFKSFAEPTQVDFHDGITAIVGPNGCGKSNISDAIRWVLGEQRPTAIRGAKMEEAIFQGTVSRRPVNRGSVSMVVSNEDGALPLPFEEVEIGRTVYRDGGSDYQLNRASCRLRDVVDLCRDTGLGANAYSVIENRMIDAILSDRADERRSLFEEAAGIGKYKDRRRAALRRLENAELDLQRLEDVIAEVQTKVRSLARQKGKAQKYQELRERRLAVEVEVVRTDLVRLEQRLGEVTRELEADHGDEVGVAAQLATAEAEVEQARLKQVEAERARVSAASELDSVRNRLATVERDVAVAQERIANGERRITQIDEEVGSLEELRSRSESELTALRGERETASAALEVVQGDLAEREKVTAEVRERLRVARDLVMELEERSRTVVRRVAQLEGDEEGAEAQVEELGRRLERLSSDVEDGAGALLELRSQGDLFSDRQASLAAKVEESSRACDDARGQQTRIRQELQEARTLEIAAETRASALDAEAQALQRLVDVDGGAQSLVTAVRADLEGDVIGTLADFVRVSGGGAKVVDDVLGRFGSAVVVAGDDELDRVRAWYRKADDARGRLVVLPLSRAPRRRGSLPPGVEAHGEGAPWVEALLGGLELIEDGADLSVSRSGPVASKDGVWVDALGAVHLLPRDGSGGLLERRERVEAVMAEREVALRDLEETRARRVRLEEEHQVWEGEADAAAARLLEARDEARAAMAEAVAQTDRQQRLDRHQEEISRQLEGTRAARDRALERGRSAAAERADLLGEEATLVAELERRRASLGEIDAQWEQAREAESEMTIRAARLENDVQRLDGRISDLAMAVDRATSRLGHLAEEAAALTEELARVRRESSDGAQQLQELFGKRDEAGTLLAERDQALQEASQAVVEGERRAREIRSAERAALDRMHQLELEKQNIQNQVGRIKERLEGEWGRPLEALLAEAERIDGSPDELRAELTQILHALERIGPVNMLAVEEHEEESGRLDFLVQQREDLVTARDDLRTAIRQINTTATELFITSFEAIRENFQQTFQHLFKGGEADLWLSDPENPLESPVEIHASPGGKRTQRIDLLSGGERALTALSLLFGIYLVKPSPFCVLDEVDAPLDESNIGRFIRLLQGFKAQTQFVVITHNPRTIEAADWIYGVTMEEPGVSSIVGVRLQEALEATGTAA